MINNVISCWLHFRKDGSTLRHVSLVRYASIFAKKYGTGFFVMIRLRYVGIRCLNLSTKRTVHVGTVRFMCNMRPSMKFRSTELIQLKIHDIAPVAKAVFVSSLYLIGQRWLHDALK